MTGARKIPTDAIAPAAASLFAVGFLAMLGQVVLLRELAVASFGVELIYLLGLSLWSAQSFANFVERGKTIPLEHAQAVARALPPRARVLTFGLSLTLQHYTGLEVFDLYALTPATLRTVACEPSPAYAFLDVGNLNDQWHGLSPETNYRWLRDVAGLEEIQRDGDYVLFRVRCRQ